jgi:type IV secretory pathway VirB10-like protein
MADVDPGTAAVKDHRVAPRGVLPRNTQMWLMVGLAVTIIGIIVFVGHPEPVSRPGPVTAAAPAAPSPDRLRDYQDRLRVLDERARQQAAADSLTPKVPPRLDDQPPAASSAATADPLREDRKRREYESLFASNVVMSRRPDGQQLMTAQPQTRSWRSPTGGAEALPAGPPSVDEVADAVVRATTRYAPPGASSTPAASIASGPPPGIALTPGSPTSKTKPAATGPITSTGPLHRILEGTVIDTVLTNRLDGSVAAPVNCLVTNAIYSHEGEYILIPAGSRVLGETKPVQSFGETRLAVAFNRLALPDGRTYPLDQFMGLNEIGDAGLRDQVNQHYRSTFGASAAVGLLTGFAQYLGSVGFGGGGSGNRTVIIAGNVGESSAQATSQTMNRFLNRLPNITIREGHRVKVYLTSDLELPAYRSPGARNGALFARTR